MDKCGVRPLSRMRLHQDYEDQIARTRCLSQYIRVSRGHTRQNNVVKIVNPMSILENLQELTAKSGSQHESDVTINSLFKRLEGKVANEIVDELTRRATAGHHDAYMNFRREDFADTGIARPNEVLRMFIDELKNMDSELCSTKRGCLHGITTEHLNNSRLTVRFYWTLPDHGM